MSQNTSLLFELLRSSLWGRPFDRNILSQEFVSIMELAGQQTVIGLVFEAIKGAKIPDLTDRTPLYEAVASVENIKVQNRLVNKELFTFASTFNEQGYEYVVVKG